jgi:hypothetical protein
MICSGRPHPWRFIFVNRHKLYCPLNLSALLLKNGSSQIEPLISACAVRTARHGFSGMGFRLRCARARRAAMAMYVSISCAMHLRRRCGGLQRARVQRQSIVTRVILKGNITRRLESKLHRTDENKGPFGIRRQLPCSGKPPSAPSLASIVTFMQDETLQPWKNAILSASHETLPAVVGEFLIWPCDRVSHRVICFRLQLWLIRLFRERTYLSG